MDETDDALNDDTFGSGESAAAKPVGKDFDFFGQTAKVSDAMDEEQARFSRQQPMPRAAPTYQTFQQPQQQQYQARPARTGYERYREPDYVPEMQVDANLWGVAPKRSTPAAAPELSQIPGSAPGGRKMMSLEEVEAAMRQAKKPAQVQAPQQSSSPAAYQQPYAQPLPQQYQPQQYQPQQHQPQQYQQQPQYPMPPSGPPAEELRSSPAGQPVRILQRSHQPVIQSPGPQGPAQQSPARQIPMQQIPTQQGPTQPIQILQNPNRHPVEQHRGSPAMQQRLGHQAHPSGSRPIITHPQQLASLTEEERAQFLEEDAKRAKRNHKIHLLSRDNGLMTPRDKNFITRIQLQQLVVATGNPNEHGTDSGLAEDFYYQVHNQIRGGPRQHPGQPLSNFAQTYLFQTGGRQGRTGRQTRGGDNHMHRMEQQVQRAVEAAKNKPKNKQLVIEGSLGKISFSNAKTPKPLLNIKRADSGVDTQKARKSNQASVNGINSKNVLRDIENVYQTLMEMEDHDRNMPISISEGDINPELVGQHMDWEEKARKLNEALWRDLKVHDPIVEGAIHPFIAFLSFNKGKRSMPRVFRHISQQQRATILTMIVFNLDQLDVIREAVIMPGESLLSAKVRESVDLFSSAVMPSLFQYLNEASLDIVSQILSLATSHTNVDAVARTRIGVSMFTMILSRAELIKQAAEVSEADWEKW